MLWTLKDGTEIKVNDDTPHGHTIRKTMADRSDLWAMIDLLDGKDLSSFTLTDGLLAYDYDGMVFTGITVCESGFEDTTMIINFGADVVVANARLYRENQELRAIAEESVDKVEGYDILTGGV